MMKTPQPISSANFNIERFGILNKVGEFWTPETFTSPQEAINYVRYYWKHDQLSADRFLRKCRIIPVIVTVEAAPSRDGRA